MASSWTTPSPSPRCSTRRASAARAALVRDVGPRETSRAKNAQVQRGFDKVIYMTGSTKFNINGTGFRSKSMNLVFDPPLVKDEDYLLRVRSATCMQLTLRTGKKWRSDGQPGPLKLRLERTRTNLFRWMRLRLSQSHHPRRWRLLLAVCLLQTGLWMANR